MSQHDFNIANQGFPAFRTDLNNGLTALATNSSGATAPSTTYAYQWWYDTTTDILKMRNADNDAWINFATFDQVNDLWSVTSLRATTEVRTPAILDATGGNTATINGIPLRQGVLDPENRIINGAFDHWQRGTSFTTAVYGADRWLNSLSGGAVTMSRQSFTVGDTLGNNSPTFFLRQSTSGQTLASHFALTQQRIEGVRAYAGQTITILGWARRSSGTGNMAIEMLQSFGTGGSPSADVTGTGQTVTLTSSWAAFAVTIAVPSITGKTLGSNGNDYLAANFWTSAGSNFNARTNSLGLQTIGVDLWGIHIKQGTHTTAAADPGTGRIRWNHATQTSATEIYLDAITNDGTDISNYFKALPAGSTLFIQDKDDAAVYQKWLVTSTTDNTGWQTLGLSLLASQGSNIPNNAITVLVFNSSVTSNAPTAEQNAAAVLAALIEGGLTLRDVMRITLAVTAGDATGLEGATMVFKSLDGTKDRVEAAYSAGDRTVTARDP